MTEEFSEQYDWEQGIIDDYPLIYREGAPKDGVNLRYGFECGKGWEGIIRKFSEKVTEIVLKAREKEPKAFVHSAIFKEKFGQLRFQGDVSVENKEYFAQAMKAILDLENESAEVCELCGGSGKIEKNKFFHYKCLCEKCKE